MTSCARANWETPMSSGSLRKVSRRIRYRCSSWWDMWAGRSMSGSQLSHLWTPAATEASPSSRAPSRRVCLPSSRLSGG